MPSRVQGHGRKADMVPARRKLHPNGAMNSTSFTEMTGFKAARVAVAETDERWGYRADPWLLWGRSEGRQGVRRSRWRLQHWPGEGDGGLDGAGMAGRGILRYGE